MSYLNNALLVPNWERWIDKALQVEPGNLIACWPLDDKSGAVARNVAPSGAAFNGAIVGASLAQPGIGDGTTSMWFDGATDFINIHSAALAAAFNGNEGTLLIWAKVANAGVWADGTIRRVAHLQVSASYAITIYRNSVNGDLGVGRNAGGWKVVSALGLSHVGWMAWAVSWSVSGDALIGYLNGTPTGSASGLGAWSGALAATTTCIGATNTTPTQPWHGSLGPLVIWDKALSPDAFPYLARLP